MEKQVEALETRTLLSYTLNPPITIDATSFEYQAHLYAEACINVEFAKMHEQLNMLDAAIEEIKNDTSTIVVLEKTVEPTSWFLEAIDTAINTAYEVPVPLFSLTP